MAELPQTGAIFRCLAHDIFEFGVQGSGFGIQGLGFRVQGVWFLVQGSGFRVHDVGTLPLNPLQTINLEPAASVPLLYCF
jgi:hypothetical protein